MLRDLASTLDYQDYRNFQTVVTKAKEAISNSGEIIHNHIVDVTEMVAIGSGAQRERDNIKLDRYACYLILQNSDRSKEVVALGQTYFAIQTRKQEVTENIIEDSKRVTLRDEVTKHNTSLASSAKQAGVSNFGVFQNDGYRGLYGGMSVQNIHAKKNLKEIAENPRSHGEWRVSGEPIPRHTSRCKVEARRSAWWNERSCRALSGWTAGSQSNFRYWWYYARKFTNSTGLDRQKSGLNMVIKTSRATMINSVKKLPQLTPDGFADWDNVSVARAIAYSNVVQIAQHMTNRDNYEHELSQEEIDKFQKVSLRRLLE